MNSVRARENTFKVDLSNFPKRPSFEEIHAFVHETIGLSIDKVQRLQINHAQNCAHVKCNDLKTAQDAVEQHDNRHEMEINNTKVKVRLLLDDGGVEVKVHDLSECIRDEDIIDYLKQFGEVLAFKELVWGANFAYKGISSGVRVAKMILHRHIKSYVTIQGEQTLISYRNQPQTCRHCLNQLHPGTTCVENKRLLRQKTDLNNRLKTSAQSKPSYANVLNKPAADILMPRFVSTNLNQLNTNRRQPVTPAADERTDENGIQNQNSVTNDTAVACKTNTNSIAPVAAAVVVAAIDDTVAADDHCTIPHVASTPSYSPPAVNSNAEPVEKEQTINTFSPRSENAFKTPTNVAIPSRPLCMEISESESAESSAEGPQFIQVKRARGRPKKQKLDTVSSAAGE